MNAVKRVSNTCTSSIHGRSGLSSSSGSRGTNSAKVSASEGVRLSRSSVAQKAVSFKSEKTTSTSRDISSGVYTSRRGIANWALQEEKNKRDYNKKVFKSIDQLNTGLKLEDKFMSVGLTSQHTSFSQLAGTKSSPATQRVTFMTDKRVPSPAVARRDAEMRTASPFLARKEYFNSSPRSSPQLSRHTRDASSFGVSH